jgi:hypothetical protein
MGMMQMLMGASSTASSGIVNPLPGGQYLAGGGNAALYQFNRDGTTDFGGSARGNWYAPTTTDIGDSYWVRFTHSSGTALDYNQATTWTQLTTSYYFGYDPAGVYKDGDVLVEISSASGGTPVVASGTYRIVHTG